MGKSKEKISIQLLKDVDGWGKKGDILKMNKGEEEHDVEVGNIRVVENSEEKIQEIPKEKEAIKELTEEEIRTLFYKIYELIKEVIKEYTDINPIYLPVLSLWTIGTYLHDEFESYPYLFINAMRGSGKTRLLKLLSTMACKGEVINNISEAVLFRSIKGGTLLLDEFEGIGKKENSTLRELLNSAYKKGAKVKRMRKMKTSDGEKYVTEDFDIYFPIAMANIWGMDEVLGDRCLTIFLEKSHKFSVVKLVENYTTNPQIRDVLSSIKLFQCSKCNVVTKENVYSLWNQYIKDKYNKNTTLTTLTTINTYTTLHYTNYIDFFNKIDNLDIDGRNLEISLPLLLLGYFIGSDILEEISNSLKEMIKEKNDEERVESQDVSFLRFLSTKETKEITITNLTSQFISFMDELDVDEKWINSKWVGRALRRLRLLISKKRLSKGVSVLIDVLKAKEKFKQYER